MLHAGRPFGIWRCCAWVPRFKELSKKPSIWAPSALQGAEQMVCNKTASDEKGRRPVQRNTWLWLELCVSALVMLGSSLELCSLPLLSQSQVTPAWSSCRDVFPGIRSKQAVHCALCLMVAPL